MGRDVLQEKGGRNLYAFSRNNSVNLWDYIGMVPSSLGSFADVLYTSEDSGGGSNSSAGNSPGKGYGAWGYGKWGWGYYNDPGDMFTEPFDINLLSLAIASSPMYASAGGIDNLGAGSAVFRRYSQSELQLVGSGVGPPIRRMYEVTIGNSMLAGDLFDLVKSNINNFSKSNNPLADTPFSPMRGSSLAIVEGNVYSIDGPGPINPMIAVTSVTSNSFTFTTMQGHPEAGTITFSAIDGPNGSVRFLIESSAQASSSASLAAYWLVAIDIQTQIWTNFLSNIVTTSGGVGGNVTIGPVPAN